MIGLVALLVLWPGRAQAGQVVSSLQDLPSMAGRVVSSVRVELEGRPVDDASLRALIEVKPDASLTVDQVRESLAHLNNLNRFTRVEFSVRPVDERVEVVFSLTPRHPVDAIEFKGTLGVDRGALERRLRDAIGARLSTVAPEDAVTAVRRVLGDEGFAHPTVSAVVEAAHDVHHATLVVTIEAGRQQQVGEITVTGASPLSRAEILETLNLSTGGPYRRRALEDGLRVVAERLRTRGYYEASASHFTTGDTDADVVDVTVDVDAGPFVTILVNGDPLPSGGVEQWVPIRRENSADQDLLEDSAFRIQTALQRDGYWRAQVDIGRVESPDGSRMVITVDVARGRRYRLKDVTIAGNDYFSEADVRALLELSFGDPFRADEVQARVIALGNAYAFAGFAATIDVVPEELPDVPLDQDGQVVVHLSITEGPARTIREVVIQGTRQIPEAEVRRLVRSSSGQPLRDAQVRQDRNAIETLYRDAGFQAADIRADLSGGPDYLLTFTIDEGPQTIVDHVIVVGNRRVDTQTILNQVTLRPGQPLGQAARLESQRQLNELAIFRRVSITSAPGATDANHVDVVIQVDEAAATTIGYGGGLELGRRVRTVADGVAERLELAPRGFLELGRRNLFGGNRSINLFSRVSLRPNNAPDDASKDGKGFGFSEYRVTGSYREGRAWRSDTDLVVSATAERAIRTSFTFERRAVNAEALRRLSPRTSIFIRYALDSTRLFDTRIPAEDQPLIDRLFPQIRLSSVSAGIVWDNRDDLLDPTSGGWLSADGEVAARALGSEVGFAKAFLQAIGFRRITRANRVVLAGRVQVGVARGFERQVVRLDANGQPVKGPDGAVLTDTVADLPAGRRFFSGGGSSVRGFQQDRLGVPGVINASGLSNGGNGLVVLNGEVRTLLIPTVSLVGFVDGGNVFAKAGEIAPSRFRGAVGVGVRYRSPLGPLRLDFGFKLDRRLISGKRERGWEFHLSIGEIF